MLSYLPERGRRHPGPGDRSTARRAEEVQARLLCMEEDRITELLGEDKLTELPRTVRIDLTVVNGRVRFPHSVITPVDRSVGGSL